ncbi:phosphoglycerate kinase [Patescibacteria group bacterium]|nr:phosphoglycerate kinase [Patescibacteria group bacterium]
MRAISKINKNEIKNKFVLLRTDLNSDVLNKKVILSERIKQSAETINFLKKRGAKVVILAHQGRAGKTDFLSLKQHHKYLTRYVKIKFMPDIDIGGKKSIKAIEKLKPNEAILLENIRFIEDEFIPEKKENKILKIASKMDIYVNDAFSNSHREHTSMLIPRYFPKIKSYAGFILEREVESLKKIKLRNCLYLLGGAKPEDNIKLLNPSNKNKVLTGGLFGQLCIIANGKDLGAQNDYLKKTISDYEKNLNELKKILKDKFLQEKIKTPLDFAVKKEGKRKELILGLFPSKEEIFDIGEKTIKRYVSEIKKAKAIYMKGPFGFCSEKEFSKGTHEILKAISNSKGFSVIGGGHLSDAIKSSKIPQKKFGHISLSGGALLRYLNGEKLPGLEVLN